MFVQLRQAVSVHALPSPWRCLRTASSISMRAARLPASIAFRATPAREPNTRAFSGVPARPVRSAAPPCGAHAKVRFELLSDLLRCNAQFLRFRLPLGAVVIQPPDHPFGDECGPLR